MRLLQRRLRREVWPAPGASSAMSRPVMQVLFTAARCREVSPREIGDELRMTSSNVAAALRELDDAGLVRREPDPVDGRRVRVSVTPEGAAFVAQFRGERDSWLGQAMRAKLTAEEQQLLFRAGELMARLAEFEIPGGPQREKLDGIERGSDS